ncbi:hypothetical protein D9758_008795 [Tetrapyrgos nigripes]|uniref:HMG box domain-containing protein n=1 Tax=Tetrapyrgos nigripes TaxID=182062 RepID=A0A8H5D4N7_9AGAR|nr:hypothetical protein D9758_008795 [Tetrapyrgos nigripes]
MPVYRNADTADIFPRRSRRLSRQEPKHYDEEGFEYFDPTLLESRHNSPDPSSESTESRTISSHSHSRSPTPYCPSPSSRSLSPSPFPSPVPHAVRRLSTTFQNGSRRHSGTHIDPASISPSTSTSTSTSSHTYSRTQPKRIPRPPNAFMLFRSHFWSTQKDRIAERDHRQISRMVGVLWNEMPQDQKEVYRLKAVEVKKEHMKRFPNYRYAPSRDGGFKKPADRRNSSASVGKGVKARRVEVQHRVKKEVAARPSATVMSTKKPRVSKDYTEVEVKKETERYMPSPKVEEEEVKMEQDIEAVAEEEADMYVDDDDVKYEEATASYFSLSTHDVAYSPGYHYKSQLDSDDEDEPEFVPTEDIPPLHLSAPALSPAAATFPVVVKAEEKQPETPKAASISPIPHSYLHIDPQFGIRPDRHHVNGSPSPRRGSSSSSASSSSFSLSSMSSFSSFTTTTASSSKSRQSSAFRASAAATVKAKVENEGSLLFSGSASSVRTADFSSSSHLSNPFSQSATPDTWLGTATITQPDADDDHLHYFYSSAQSLDASSEQFASGAPPECFLDELLESFQMGVGLDPMSLDTMFEELVEMPLPLPEESKKW